MELRNSELPPRFAPARQVGPNFVFRVSIFILLGFVAGCASPGEPVARTARVPTPISDLSATQYGNGVVLTFTMPRDAIDRHLLKRTPQIEIYRGFSSTPPQAASAQSRTSAGTPSEQRPLTPVPAAAAGVSNLSPLITIPSALVNHYQHDGTIRYAEPWTADILKAHAGEFVTYMVLTAESQKKPSAASNLASLHVYATPDPISDLKAHLALAAVNLAWTVPQQTPIGPAPTIENYVIYRSEVSAGASTKSSTTSHAVAISGIKQPLNQPEKIATSQSNFYQDTDVQLGATYQYFVRSVVDYSGESVQSADSNAITITMRDVFPPTAPTGLVTVPLPAQNGRRAQIDLSWDLNSETDVAGYNVYRSGQQDTPGTRLNSQLLPTPAFSDISAVAGQLYFYRITAVDRSGNESKPSAAVSGEIPAKGQPKQ